jgi:RND family efflux transporter MFP subunit
MRTLALLIVAAVASVDPVFASGPAPAGAEHTVTTVRPVVTEFISLTFSGRRKFVGVVAAKTETDLAFPLNGTMASRLVEIGDLIETGDLVAQLDPEDLDSDLRTRKASVLIAQAQLRAAADSERRARQLSERGVDAATRLEDAVRMLAAAKAQLAQAEAAYARALDMRGFAELTAPNDGVITRAFVEAGATVSSGEAVARLAATGEREIVLDVSEQIAARLEKDLTFDVQLVASPSVTTTAVIARIDLEAEHTTRTRRFHLTMDGTPEGFRLGALVNISVEATESGGISIPESAVFDAAGEPSVWRVDRTTDTVHILPIAQGLEAGDEIVVKGINSLKDGQTVGARVTQ